MHERAAVTRGLSEVVAASQVPIARVSARIGPDVDRDVVADTWQTAARGTFAQDAELVCESVDHVLRCLGCETDYPGRKLTPCPRCGALGLIIETAPEFAVIGWESA